MNAAKRRRGKAITATPTAHQSNDSRASSFIQTSPLSRLQRAKPLQQRLTKRPGLHLPRQHARANIPPSHTHVTCRGSRFPSITASGVDVAQEDGNEGKQEDDSDLDEVIMCVDMRERGTVGCSYYESSTGSLRLVEDVQCGGLDVVDTCEHPFTDDFCRN